MQLNSSVWPGEQFVFPKLSSFCFRRVMDQFSITEWLFYGLKKEQSFLTRMRWFSSSALLCWFIYLLWPWIMVVLFRQLMTLFTSDGIWVSYHNVFCIFVDNSVSCQQVLSLLIFNYRQNSGWKWMVNSVLKKKKKKKKTHNNNNNNNQCANGQKLMLHFKELHYQTASFQCMFMIHVHITICKYTQYRINTIEHSPNHPIFTNLIKYSFHHTFDTETKFHLWQWCKRDHSYHI